MVCREDVVKNVVGGRNWSEIWMVGFWEGGATGHQPTPTGTGYFLGRNQIHHNQETQQAQQFIGIQQDLQAKRPLAI